MSISNNQNIAKALYNLSNMIASPSSAQEARNATQAMAYWSNVLKSKPIDEQGRVQTVVETWLSAGKMTIEDWTVLATATESTVSNNQEKIEMTNVQTANRNQPAHIFGTDKYGEIHEAGDVAYYLILKAVKMALETEKAVNVMKGADSMLQGNQFKKARQHIVNAEVSKRRQLLNGTDVSLKRLHTEMGGSFLVHELLIAAINQYMVKNKLTIEDIPVTLHEITREKVTTLRDAMNLQQAQQISFQAEAGLRQDEYKPVTAADIFFRLIYDGMKSN